MFLNFKSKMTLDIHYNLAFFEKIMLICRNGENLVEFGCDVISDSDLVLGVHQSQGLESEADSACQHLDMADDNGKVICSDCGELLSENFTVNHHSNLIGMKKRRKVQCNIYNDIPSYIPQHIKNISIDIYQKITTNRIFRNTFKKAILMACLHRAASLKNCDISSDDLLSMFSLKQHEANRGFAFLSNNLSKDSIYFLPFNSVKDEEVNIASILKNLGMMSLVRPVINIFNLIKEKSNLLNESLCKSVICGCIYFWIRYRKIKKSLKDFAVDVGKSEITILNKYIVISDVIIHVIMKELFSTLLKHGKAKPVEGKNKFKNMLKNNKASLYGPDLKVFVHHPLDAEQITVALCHAKTPELQTLPLDDVDDIKEWNILLDKRYYTYDSKVIILNTSLTKNTRDLVINFTNYNKINDADGDMLLLNILNNRFD